MATHVKETEYRFVTGEVESDLTFMMFPKSIQMRMMAAWHGHGEPAEIVFHVTRWMEGGVGPGYARFRLTVKSKIEHDAVVQKREATKQRIEEEKERIEYMQFRKRMIELCGGNKAKEA
jgi:hypothetical protein